MIPPPSVSLGLEYILKAISRFFPSASSASASFYYYLFLERGSARLGRVKKLLQHCYYVQIFVQNELGLCLNFWAHFNISFLHVWIWNIAGPMLSSYYLINSRLYGAPDIKVLVTWNFIVNQLKFNGLLHPIEHPKNQSLSNCLKC